MAQTSIFNPLQMPAGSRIRLRRAMARLDTRRALSAAPAVEAARIHPFQPTIRALAHVFGSVRKFA